MTKIMFFDEKNLERVDNIDFVLHKPEKYSNKPLISSHNVNSELQTVFYDEEEECFKVWYAEFDKNDEIVLTYWISKDGTTWERPCLNIFENSNYCNTVMKGTGLAGDYGVFSNHRVVKDKAEKDPSKRYKMLYWDKPKKSRSGTLTAYSKDGINWINESDDFALFSGHDSFSVMVDTMDVQYNCFQIITEKRGFKQFTLKDNLAECERVCGVRTSKDFKNWSDLEVLFRIDDDLSEDIQNYFLTVNIYEGIYVGFFTTYYTERQKANTRFIYSYDGKNWEKRHSKETFLYNGSEGEFDSCWAGIKQHLCRFNNKLYLYYDTSNRTHNWAVWYFEEKLFKDKLHEYNENFKRINDLNVYEQEHVCGISHELEKLIDERLEKEAEQCVYGMGLSIMREDGFVSATNKCKGGVIITKPILIEKEVKINCNCINGSISVGILDILGNIIHGFESEKCVITGKDDTEILLNWGCNTASHLEGKLVKFSLFMNNCELYSLIV